tara:strand:- start:11 stop:331 length:321 start_codon:yes stop_codon:yes gene_type:complete
MKKKTKHQKIKDHLESGKSITSWQAIQEYNVTRLASVIYYLKKEGLLIQTKNITEKNSSGETVKYAKYKLLNIDKKNDQIGMFSNKPSLFKRWLDTPPKLKKGDIR